MIRRPPRSTLFPTRRSSDLNILKAVQSAEHMNEAVDLVIDKMDRQIRQHKEKLRSEEHTSELQSQSNLVCRLLLEKKKKIDATHMYAQAVVTGCSSAGTDAS